MTSRRSANSSRRISASSTARSMWRSEASPTAAPSKKLQELHDDEVCSSLLFDLKHWRRYAILCCVAIHHWETRPPQQGPARQPTPVPQSLQDDHEWLVHESPETLATCLDDRPAHHLVPHQPVEGTVRPYAQGAGP